MLTLLLTLVSTAATALAATGFHWLRDRSRERLYRSVAGSLPRGGTVREHQSDGSAWELRIPTDGS